MANSENQRQAQSKEKNKGKGKDGGLSSAVNSTEKIRTWVIIFLSSLIQNEHMIENEQLAIQLETKIKNKETDKNYFGLTDV